MECGSRVKMSLELPSENVSSSRSSFFLLRGVPGGDFSFFVNGVDK